MDPNDNNNLNDLASASTTAAAGSTEEVCDYISLHSDHRPRLSILVAGNAGCGKTALIRTFMEKYFPQDLSVDSDPYLPFIHRRTYHTEISVDQCCFELDIMDTLRSDCIVVGRPEDIDVVLLCYSVCALQSFNGGVLYWHDAVRCASAIARRQIPVLLIGLKVDTRIMSMNEEGSGDHLTTVTLKEGYEMAQALRVYGFYEASSYRCKGVKEVFENAVRAAAIAKQNCESLIVRSSRSRLGWLGVCGAPRTSETEDDNLWCYVLDKPKVQHPIIAACPQPLAVSVPPSLIMENRWSLLDKGILADVVFTVNEGKEVTERYAHSVILSAASPVFSTLFVRLAQMTRSNPSSTHHQLLHSVIDSVDISVTQHDCLHRIHLNRPITVIALDLTLRFMYTGGADLFLQGDILDDVIYIARLFEIRPLCNCCYEVQAASVKLGGYVNMGVSREMVYSVNKHLLQQFHCKDHLSDVKFDIGDCCIPAHRALLVCRSDVMRAMLTGPFSEEQCRRVQMHETSKEALTTFLEFVYIGETRSLSQVNAMEVLALADRFCLPRLVSLCEAFVSVRLLSWGEDLRDPEMVQAMLSTPDYSRESVFDVQRHSEGDLSIEALSVNTYPVEEEGLLVRSSSYRQALNIDEGLEGTGYLSPSIDLSHLLSILKTAEMTNAKQLVDICRYILATNYDYFSQSPTFSQLVEDVRSYVEGHRWPPAWAEQAMQVYREQLSANRAMSESARDSHRKRSNSNQCCVM